jgi:hypothetical protein
MEFAFGFETEHEGEITPPMLSAHSDGKGVHTLKKTFTMLSKFCKRNAICKDVLYWPATAGYMTEDI